MEQLFLYLESYTIMLIKEFEKEVLTASWNMSNNPGQRIGSLFSLEDGHSLAEIHHGQGVEPNARSLVTTQTMLRMMMLLQWVKLKARQKDKCNRGEGEVVIVLVV